MNKSIVKKVLVFLVPLVAVFLLYILAVYVANNISLPPCITYTLFHINCPGCGMTRSVIALLHFDFLFSLRQNAFIIVGIVLALMYYIELVLKVFGSQKFYSDYCTILERWLLLYLRRIYSVFFSAKIFNITFYATIYSYAKIYIVLNLCKWYNVIVCS